MNKKMTKLTFCNKIQKPCFKNIKSYLLNKQLIREHECHQSFLNKVEKKEEENPKNVIPTRQLSNTHSYAVFIQCKTSVLSPNSTSGMQPMDKDTIKSFKSYIK
jgi:hypothetical protein